VAAGAHCRECYEKDGQWLPGKKGIMLKPDQWATLAGAARDISAALDARNTAYKLSLGSKCVDDGGGGGVGGGGAAAAVLATGTPGHTAAP
jgi:hypothetical protein